jgi:hypothetical protein
MAGMIVDRKAKNATPAALRGMWSVLGPPTTRLATAFQPSGGELAGDRRARTPRRRRRGGRPVEWRSWPTPYPRHPPTKRPAAPEGAVSGVGTGAEDEARTRDLNLGKVALYQLSYFRVGVVSVATTDPPGLPARPHRSARPTRVLTRWANSRAWAGSPMALTSTGSPSPREREGGAAVVAHAPTRVRQTVSSMVRTSGFHSRSLTTSRRRSVRTSHGVLAEVGALHQLLGHLALVEERGHDARRNPGVALGREAQPAHAASDGVRVLGRRGGGRVTARDGGGPAGVPEAAPERRTAGAAGGRGGGRSAGGRRDRRPGGVTGSGRGGRGAGPEQRPASGPQEEAAGRGREPSGPRATGRWAAERLWRGCGRDGSG